MRLQSNTRINWAIKLSLGRGPGLSRRNEEVIL